MSNNYAHCRNSLQNAWKAGNLRERVASRRIDIRRRLSRAERRSLTEEDYLSKMAHHKEMLEARQKDRAEAIAFAREQREVPGDKKGIFSRIVGAIMGRKN